MPIELVAAIACLLPVAAASGWWMAKRGKPKPRLQSRNSLKKEYFQGLNFLVNDQTDQALEVFMRMMELDDDTVETHLALGSLFRRRGEVDRALRIHQNLIARPQLSRVLRQQATLELAKDFSAAGLYDRAENLLTELLTQNAHVEQALDRLAQIYEQQKDWAQAIGIARRKASFSGDSQASLIAHYYCEQADVADQNNDLRASRTLWRRALSTDASSIRAGLALADKAVEGRDPRAALRYLHKALQGNIEYTPIALPLLAECYLQMQNPDGLRNELESLSSRYGGVSPLLPLLQLAQQSDDQQTLDDILTHFIESEPRLASTARLIVELGASDTTNQPLFEALKTGVANKTNFQCKQCGYNAMLLHWNCPSCRSWDTVLPQSHMAIELPYPSRGQSSGVASLSQGEQNDSKSLH
jgi:lipopolysaccharide biosynthesis regulator YciM